MNPAHAAPNCSNGGHTLQNDNRFLVCNSSTHDPRPLRHMLSLVSHPTHMPAPAVGLAGRDASVFEVHSEAPCCLLVEFGAPRRSPMTCRPPQTGDVHGRCREATGGGVNVHINPVVAVLYPISAAVRSRTCARKAASALRLPIRVRKPIDVPIVSVCISCGIIRRIDVDFEASSSLLVQLAAPRGRPVSVVTSHAGDIHRRL